ncbi:MAG: hypothetical protein ACM3QZ_14700 [Solirubrobacterales bacterium]
MSDRCAGKIFVFACALFVAVVSIWAADPDVFWHLKVGQWIVAHHQIPAVDVYSWSQLGQPWMAHQWAWEALSWLVYQTWKLPGLWLMTALAGGAAGCLVAAGLDRRYGETTLAYLAGGLSVLYLLVWLKPWPQAGVYAFFGFYLWLSLAGYQRRNAWILTGAAAAVWANVHSNVVLFPLLLLAECAFAVIARREIDRRKLALALAAFLGSLLNPRGIGLWVYAVREGLLTGIYRHQIQEWMPYPMDNPWLLLVFISGCAVLLAAAAQNRLNRLAFWRAALFWLLALGSRIYTPFAVLSTAVLLGSLDLRISRIRLKPLAWIGWGVVAAMFLAQAGKNGIPLTMDQLARANQYPAAAVDYIERNHLTRVYNFYGWGGYLIWRGIPVFIDGRGDLYRSGGLLPDYMNFAAAPGSPGRNVLDTGAKTILIPAKPSGSLSKLNDSMLKESPDWKAIYRDHTAVIYQAVERNR